MVIPTPEWLQAFVESHSAHHYDSLFCVGVVKAGADRSVPQPEQEWDSTMIDSRGYAHAPDTASKYGAVREPRGVMIRFQPIAPNGWNLHHVRS